MLRKFLVAASTIDNTTLNTLAFSPKNHTTIDLLNKKDHSCVFSGSKKRISTQYQKEIKQKKTKNKNMKINSNIFNNHNLLSKYYAKSLKFAFNNIYAVNTQFNNYNKNNNNENTYRTINNKRMKYNLQTSNNNSNNNLIKRTFNSDNSNYINNKYIMMNHRNNNNQINKSLNKLSLNEINKKVIKIQSYYRYYFARKKLYNTFLLYAKISNIFNIIMNKFIYYKHILINNLLNNDDKKIKLDDPLITERQSTNKDNCYEICNIAKITFEKQNINNNGITRKEKGNIINYTVCNINNINISNIKGNNQNKSFLEDKKRYEEKIIQLVNENNMIKEKNFQFQRNEEIYINIKLENEKLNKYYNTINLEKNQLLSELNTIKEKYQKLLNDKKKAYELNITKLPELEINIRKEKEGEVIDVKEDIIKAPKIDNKKEREKYLRNLFKTKVFEMRDYVHKNFIKFYYNGIFLQMTGKLKHLEKNAEKSENNEIPELNNLSFVSEKASENEIENNNLNIETEKTKEITTNINKKKSEEKIETEEEREKNEKKKRLQKSRGLRRLMAKKANERLETLRINFYKFYKAGIISQFRSIKKRRTCQVKGRVKFNLDSKYEPQDLILSRNSGMKSAKNLSTKEIDEREELKDKIVKSLKKIIFKADRRNMIIMKKKFQKFYLKTKLESVQSIIVNDKTKKKKKKKIKKKSKSNKSAITSSVSKEIIENDNNDIEGQINENENNLEEDSKNNI